MWAVYPHGVFPWTPIFYWGLNPAFNSLLPCIHSGVFMIPLLRDLAGWMGCISANKRDIINALENGNSVLITPGGLQDIQYKYNKIKKRRGFLKIAKETKTSVVPVWIDGERQHYSYFIWGNSYLPFLPKKIQTRIIIGEPISLKNISVEEGYDLYYSAISKLQNQKR